MKTGNTGSSGRSSATPSPASMEPGHEDREYEGPDDNLTQVCAPQWSPVMKTGNTGARPNQQARRPMPQWSPVMKTGNTTDTHVGLTLPGGPQWSPVMKTGNTQADQEGEVEECCLNGARS